MYRLETSTGLEITATTAEKVVSALTNHVDHRRVDTGFSWRVTTPHGTVLSDDISAVPGPADGSTVAAAGVEHAYGLLVRDHLTHATSALPTGLLHTS